MSDDTKTVETSLRFSDRSTPSDHTVASHPAPLSLAIPPWAGAYTRLGTTASDHTAQDACFIHRDLSSDYISTDWWRHDNGDCVTWPVTCCLRRDVSVMQWIYERFFVGYFMTSGVLHGLQVIKVGSDATTFKPICHRLVTVLCDYCKLLSITDPTFHYSATHVEKTSGQDKHLIA